MIAVVTPGQGAQRPGFLAPWLEVSGFERRLEQLSVAAEMDLVALGTTADAATITDTANAQPLIVASGIVSARLLDLDPADTVWAGHSVGELTAAALSGVLTDREAVRLAVKRGQAMAAASRPIRTGMSAVLGGEPSDVLAVLDRLGLTAANINATDQVVAAGNLDGLTALRADPPAGSRIVPLRVAGAFHTGFMRPAQCEIKRAIAEINAGAVTGVLLSNVDGASVATGVDALERLVHQVCAPVRWDLVTQQLTALGVRRVVEVVPAGTLAGLLRRSDPNLDIVALRTPADLSRERAAFG